MQDAKEEVRAKLNIEDVIGEYVQLKRAGRSFKGLSPFSGEKTPSFYVSPDKNIWHDFSSNKGGDVFSFVMEVEGLDFRQALEHLARKAGVDLSLYENKGSQDLAKRKKRLLEANRLAAVFFQQNLLRNDHAVEYVFNKRRISKETVREFMIGYAPDSGDALSSALQKKGFSKKEIADAGLANQYGGDLFRGRMMIALMDPSGQVIGFTGRILADIKNAPKYLNTPQTLIYDKGRHVFGLSQAKQAIREKEYVVVVEGNLDVISSHQAQVRHVIATAGTAMTEFHFRALKRLTGDVRLAFDGDKAGVAATERTIGIASDVGVELSVVTLPGDTKDPDELIQESTVKWQSAIDASQPAVDWVLGQYAARTNLSTAAGKRSFTSAALAIIKKLSDPVEKEHYEQKIASMTNSTLGAVREKSDQSPHRTQPLKQTKNPIAEKPSELLVHQDDALAAALLDVASQDAFGHLQLDLFIGDERRAVAAYLAQNAGKVVVDTPRDLQKYDTYVKILLLRAEARYAGMDPQDRVFETARLLRQIEQEHKKQRQLELITQLRSAEESGDETRANDLRITLNGLIKEISRGKR